MTGPLEHTPAEQAAARQRALPLSAPRHDGATATELIPARILNEFVYCPRLAYLEWVQKEWAESADTIEGAWVHRRADIESGDLPAPEELLDGHKGRVTALALSSEHIGVTCKLDVLELQEGAVVPVDYKRGKRPHVPRHAYDPERVQLCAQGLLLEDAGYTCSYGILYFAASRERVKVLFDEDLRQQTLEAIDVFRSVVDAGRVPPPLEDSPKCPRCSLVGICMPDEVGFLQNRVDSVRPVAVDQTRALPVYVQAHRAKVAKHGDRLEITVDDEAPVYARLAETSSLVVMGNVYVTTPTLHEMMRRQIPVDWHSYGGWFMGHTIGTGHGNVELRTAQYRGSFDERVCLQLARGWVNAKIRNCRALLRRNHRDEPGTDAVLTDLKRLGEQALRTRTIASLLGVEGSAAARYFSAFRSMLSDNQNALGVFDFHSRNRRPPTDPINALLSFGYAMLTRECTNVLSRIGMDPYRGFFHQPRFGRPSLALDMMEPFRPLFVDSCVVRAVNNGELGAADVIQTPVGVNLNATGRKKFIAAFERRLAQQVTHPLFGYRVDGRRLLEIQARLLGRYLAGEIPDNPNYVTR